VIDLSSDTATRPTQGMRDFMAKAPVGDEQRREDPTVNELQQLVADLTGKEAGLFLPSGTMCNAIAFTVHCERGDAVILDRWAHPNIAEGGGPALLAGAMVRPVHGERGVFTAEQAAEEISKGGTHTSRTAMVSIENTTNRGGGKIWPLERVQEMRALCDEHDMILHMDGARLMNAVVGSGNSAQAYGSLVDTTWIDLSKGLGAPVGAVLVGSREFIEKARLLKHRFGGAMRQAGVIAAAGLYAFEHNVERMAQDHANAKVIEDGIRSIPGVRQMQGPVETNIILFDVSESGKTAAEVERKLEEQGVRMAPYVTPTWIRAVTHLDVTRADCERAVEALRQAVA
jgi:threonine aldolase